MVNIKDIRPGNLIVHKDVGVCLIIKVIKSNDSPYKSIIKACDADDSIYEGPCEDWYYLWANSGPFKKCSQSKNTKDKKRGKSKCDNDLHNNIDTDADKDNNPDENGNDFKIPL